MTGADRGLYDHPAARPPTPRPATSNDISARVARIEEHIQFAAYDRHRVEVESRRRGMDNAEAISGLATRTTALEAWRQTQIDRSAVLISLISGSRQAVQYAMAIILFALLALGKLTVADVKILAESLKSLLG